MIGTGKRIQLLITRIDNNSISAGLMTENFLTGSRCCRRSRTISFFSFKDLLKLFHPTDRSLAEVDSQISGEAFFHEAHHGFDKLLQPIFLGFLLVDVLSDQNCFFAFVHKSPPVFMIRTYEMPSAAIPSHDKKWSRNQQFIPMGFHVAPIYPPAGVILPLVEMACPVTIFRCIK
jgi:hypothetical protein